MREGIMNMHKMIPVINEVAAMIVFLSLISIFLVPVL